MKYLRVMFNKQLTLFFSLILGSYSISFSQSQTDIKLIPFLILVESTDEGLQFSCPKGCAWTQLSFSLYNGEIQAVNTAGMTNEITNNLDVANNLADFHFEVSKDEKNIYFKGLKGTAWLELSFSSGNGKHHQYFDEYGSRDKD
jgi:hypothetical protein